MNLSRARQIVNAVAAEFSGSRNGRRIDVLREFTRVYDDSLTIVVHTTGRWNVNKLLDRFMEVEDQIEKKFKTSVLIVPAHPEVCDVPKRIGVPR